MQDNDIPNGEHDGGPVPADALEITDPDEVLLRHIRQAWYHDGIASSQNFEPMPKDNSHLSTEREALITADAAFSRWHEWGRDSAAVYGIPVNFYLEQKAPCFHVPVEEPGEENPEHALVRYPLTRSQASKLASKAKKRAIKRFQP